MEFILVLIVVLLLVFSILFNFMAFLSTSIKKRSIFIRISVGIYFLVVGIYYFYFLRMNIEPKLVFLDTYMVYIFGFFFIHLIANIINQNRIETPIVFVKRRERYLEVVWSIFSFIVILWYLFLMYNLNLSDGVFVAEREYLGFLIGMILFLCYIPISIIIYTLQRTAFCKNGLFYKTFFYDWSNFGSYTWNDNRIVIEKNWAKRPIQVFIPIEKKQAVEEFVRSKLKAG